MVPHRRHGANLVSRSPTRVFVAACIVAATLGGCADAPQRKTEPDTGGLDCEARFARDEQLILHARIRDAQYHVIPGRPYLRTDRFHAGLTDRLHDRAARETWLGRLAAFDRASRAIEHRNLGPAARPSAADSAALDDCRQRLVQTLTDDDAAFETLRTNLRVPDNYAQWQRVIGFYPLSARIVLRQVRQLHARETRYFSRADAALSGARTYAMAAPVEPAKANKIVANAPRDALGLPMFSEAERAVLFAAHGPVFAVTGTDPVDRIGRITLDGDTIVVDDDEPVVYTYLTHTRFAGAFLPQLNYTVWFPARARRGLVDIYAGWLDGITWRVTLDTDGSVLIADVMHNCGCYYMAFPGAALTSRARDPELAEPLWSPRSLPAGDGGRIMIELSGGEHYVRGLARAGPGVTADTVLQPLPYEMLKRLGTNDGQTQSLFGPDGLVAGSARAERFILWPMGIASAGAMRVAGNHPIAFVGRRHFDDPDLFDRYFERSVATP